MGNFSLILVLIILINSMNAVKVTIFYESLCSSSIHFIRNQLYPNYLALKDHLTIEFVPYGKAYHRYDYQTNKYVFNCQHGRMECVGNLYQACALKYINNQDTKVEFVNCVMGSWDPSSVYLIRACANIYNLDFNQISNCATSTDGRNLLAANGVKTRELEPYLDYVPTIVLHDQRRIDKYVQNKALTNFGGLICDEIMGPKPAVCPYLGMYNDMWGSPMYC